MQLSLQRRMHKGWQYGLSYTWSHNVDDISGNQTASDTNTGVNWITYYPDKSMYRGLSYCFAASIFRISASAFGSIAGISTFFA